jgi:hypothetical protein
VALADHERIFDYCSVARRWAGVLGEAAEGYRCWVLVLGEESAAAIAASLNWGEPRPSAHNLHRLADGWQGSTVRVTLEDQRYWGCAFFGRRAKTLCLTWMIVRAAGSR